jgi:hypothetical protein
MDAPSEEGIADETDTLVWLLNKSKRTRGLPLRHAFVHHPESGGGPGPLARFMRREGALDLYLLLMLLGTGGSHTIELPLAVWSRALGRGTSETAELWVSKTLTWIEGQDLISTKRVGRTRQVTILDESGRGAGYARPRSTKGDPWEWFLVLPMAYWREGWHKELSLPGKAALLVSLTQRPEFVLSQKNAARWYGLSEDTMARGLRELQDVGLLAARPFKLKAPELRHGYTLSTCYALTGSFKRGLPPRRQPKIKRRQKARRTSRDRPHA